MSAKTTGDVKLFPGDKAPYFGILVSEIRYRQFINYRNDSERMDAILLEQNFEINRLKEELDGRYDTSNKIMWFLVGILVSTGVVYATSH